MESAPLATALAHHRRGDLDQAERLYREILAAQPDHADALHLLGLVFLQRGDARSAIEWIDRAVRVSPSVAAFHANLAEAYRAVREFELAANCCRVALQLRPDYAAAHNSLGLVRMDQGRPADAVEPLQAALRLRPDFALAHNNLGNAYRLLGDVPQALTHFHRAVELDPDLPMARSNLGQMLLERKRFAEALEHCQAAVRLQPNSAPARNNLGNVLRELGRLGEAKARYAEALRLEPNLAMLHNNIGQVLEEEGALDDALRWYQQAINLEPNTARFHVNRGGALREKGAIDEAVACYGTALRLHPGCAEAHAGLGWVEHERGRFDEARAHYREALRLKPDLALAHGNLGQLMQELNDLPAAESHLRQAIQHDPRNTAAYEQLATLLRDRMPEPQWQAMQQLAAEPLLSDGKRAALLFGLAHVHDARGAYEQAGECLRQAHALERAWRAQRGQGWDPAVHTRFVDQLLSAFAPEFFRRVDGWGLDSERPVFLVGLPRSGTTLLEQVLASHSQVFGAGELRLGREDFEALQPGGDEPACFAALQRLDRDDVRRLAARHLDRLGRLNATAARVTDKMPDNYMYLGLLHVLFPRVRFIHCRRDLRDVAVSCWMTHFRQVPWANDIDHIAARFRDYRRIMAHWARVLPAPVLEVSYEDTVRDLEGVARRLVAWCGLEWEPACLQFYRTQRPVRTASVTQVRQPVYTRSVVRWRHYEPALAPSSVNCN